MAIDLKPEQQRVIDLAIQSGAYQTPSDVLDRAFEILREQLDMEAWIALNREAVAAQIEEGFLQAERGELTPVEEALELIKSRRASQLPLR